jgi:hypothetical protein
MARLYDAIEPEVVSMDMLQSAVNSLRPDGENQLIPREDKLDYSAVDALRLDYRSRVNCFTPMKLTFVLIRRHSSNGEPLVVWQSDKIANG